MRWLRLALLFAAFLVLLLILAGYIAYRNQDRLVKLVLDRIEARSGFGIAIASAGLSFNSHLVVILEKPRILNKGVEIAHFDELRAVISYHALLYTNGLPLFSLALINPSVTVPPQFLSGGSGLPRLDPQAPDQLRALLRQAAAVTRRLDVDGMTIFAGDGKSPICGGSFTAYHHHHEATRWYLRSDLHWMAAPLEGVSFQSRIVTDAEGDVAGNIAAHGDIHVARDRPTTFSIANFNFTGRGDALVEFRLRDDGNVSAHAAINAADLTVSGSALKAPVALGASQAELRTEIDPNNIAIPEFSVRQDQSQLIRGNATFGAVYSPQPSIDVNLSAISIAAGTISRALANWRAAPKTALSLSSSVKSGRVDISKIGLKTRLSSLQKSATAELRRSLNVTGTVVNLNAAPAFGAKPLNLTAVNLPFSYARNVVSVTNGSAKIGRTRLKQLTGQVNLSGFPKVLPYTVRVSGDLAVDEAYRLALDHLPAVEKRLRGKIELLGGVAHFQVSASGRLDPANPGPPSDFSGQIAPAGIEVGLKSIDRAITLDGGTIGAQPGLLRVNRLVVQAAGSNNRPNIHSVIVTSDLSRPSDRVVFHNTRIEFHQVSAQAWMPVFVDSASTAVEGDISGTLLADGYIGKESNYRVTGNLTIGPGQVQFGFLHKPIVTSSSLITFDGKGVKFRMPNARLEGSRVDLTCTIADFNRPSLDLDANVDRLDLEVMEFIRMPWSPPTPVTMFLIPVDGHLTARTAILERLVMTNATADYNYDHGDWWVRNLKANTNGGKLAEELTGRKTDDWIHIKSDAQSIDAAQLTEAFRPGQPPFMIGTIDANADLWADTNDDFFSTMRGKVAITITRGRLAKLRLLSRILGLIDLRNWLTRSASDPRVSGLPFDSIGGEFDGDRGVFQTDDLRLSGPVMDALARGNIDLGDQTVNMQIGMVPFNTVSWLMSKIPLIGTNLALSSGTLLAAYVQVHGPLENPKVSAKPITSVAEFIKKTISLPINVVRPNTVR